MRNWIFGILLLFTASGTYGAILVARQYSTPTPTPIQIESPVTVPTSELAPISTPTPTAAPTTTLLFGGDVMLGRYVETRISQHGAPWITEAIAPITREADLAIVNLESPFRTDAPQTKTDSLVLRGAPDGIGALTTAGIDLVSIANNHITDMGSVGLIETKTTLSKHDIASVGAGENDVEATNAYVTTRNGIRFGFLSYTYGVNFQSKGVHYALADTEEMATAVTSLKKSADVVIVLCHCGTEYADTPSMPQEHFARTAISSGATLYIGHHPHVPQRIERYQNGLIAYSLGNLVFDQQPGEWRDQSALLSITLSGTTPTLATLTPYTITSLAKPVPSTGTTRANTCRRFAIEDCTLHW